MLWAKALLGALGIGGDYLKAKADLKKTEVVAKADLIKMKTEQGHEWETAHVKASESSWKDEFWTLVWSVPVILCFVPGGAERAKAGFDALAQMPEWYTYTLVTIVLASFGIRFGGRVKESLDAWRK